MNWRKILPIALFIACPCFATSFSDGESVEVENEQQLIELILQNEEYCLSHISTDKIYLNPKKVRPTREGVFLKIDRFFLVKLPSIYSDQEGCYIKLPQQ